MDADVLINRVLGFRAEQTLDGLVYDRVINAGVQPAHSGQQSVDEHDVGKRVAQLWAIAARRDTRPVKGLVAEVGEPLQGGLLDDGFVDVTHGAVSTSASSTHRASTLSAAGYSRPVCSSMSSGFSWLNGLRIPA